MFNFVKRQKKIQIKEKLLRITKKPTINRVDWQKQVSCNSFKKKFVTEVTF